ncbi:MarR family winged helix-turn-helix transcriptional regulator [Saccharospirillum sp.]|uniref:MarR family winged helix-turn-helix transcriptional regulator n=1 Tax=Saccharospirillum sp. TaxID=2033801 RepID=UPI0034A06B02
MKRAPLADANAMPGNLLRRCHQISVALFLKHCDALGLTQLQYAALVALEEKGPLDQITLGGYTAMDRNTIALVVRKLEERGSVTRVRNPEDRRAIIVTLTEAGAALRAEAETTVRQVQDDIVAPLSETEREHLALLLGKIARAHNDQSRVRLQM